MRLRLRLLAALTVVLAAMVGAERAGACSCADIDERVRLESEIGVIGRVIDRQQREQEGGAVDYRYRVRVDRSVGAKLGREVTIAAPDDGCGSGPLDQGEVFAGFPRRRGRGWTVNGCSVVDPVEFRRALQPFPRPQGPGRLALLAGGHFGTARLMALDRRGRVLGYGFGGGTVTEMSVCPGGEYAAELVFGRRRLMVAVRELRSLRVLRVSKLPVGVDQVDPGQATVRCNEATAGSVHAATGTYIRRKDRVRVFSAAAGEAAELASARGFGVLLGGSAAYFYRRAGLFALDLTGGGVRRLTDYPYSEALALSPDARKLVFYADGRLRLVDTQTGEERSRRVRPGFESRWLTADRFFFRMGGEARIYDTNLDVLRRYSFFGLTGDAVVGDRVYGTDRFELHTLHLPSGRRRTVSELPARGILDLEGVAGATRMEADLGRPGLGYEVLHSRRLSTEGKLKPRRGG